MDTLAPMDRKPRSEYGDRLLAARKHKGMSQTALAKAVGMSQSAYGQAETTGSGSSFTSQLAEVCGVRAHWLATGEGPMLVKSDGAEISAAERIQSALDVLSKVLLEADEDTRIAVGELLSTMATSPATVKNKSRLILKLLVTSADNPPVSPQDGNAPTSHISVTIPRITVGGEDGQSNTDAATGGRKK
jgi:transcriptional regulator with XRE-family HTH domain